MSAGKTIFSQLMDFLPRTISQVCRSLQRHYKVKSFSCWDQFLSMAFAQLTFRKAFEISRHAGGGTTKLYHMAFAEKFHATPGQRQPNARLAYLCRLRSRAYRYGQSFTRTRASAWISIKQSTPSILPLSIFACRFSHGPSSASEKGRETAHAVGSAGQYPTLIFITHGEIHDVNILDDLLVEAGAIYVMDRGYLDFARLHRMHQSMGFFITRTKSNFRFRRLYSHPVDRTTGLQCDQTIVLKGFYSRRDYPRN